jgi:lipopolysaccharide biosynthesis regulator YciM
MYHNTQLQKPFQQALQTAEKAQQINENAQSSIYEDEMDLTKKELQKAQEILQQVLKQLDPLSGSEAMLILKEKQQHLEKLKKKLRKKG